MKLADLNLSYAGRDAEIAFLRAELANVGLDPRIRVRWQARLEYVERRTDEQLHVEMTGRPRPS